MHLLTWLLLLPMVGAIVIGILPASRACLVRPLAIAAASITLAYAIWLAWLFDGSSAGIQMLEQVSWNPRLGTSYAVGIDGLSLPMVLLATLLSWVAVFASHSIREREKRYYLLLLTLESAMLGVFCARDWALFYIFWELTLIPLFFLIDGWGGRRRHGAALNFVLYTLGGSVFMLISLLLAYDLSPVDSFAMDELARAAGALPLATQTLIFAGLLIGFGVKMPIFPIHGWLPLAHVEAPSPISILLSGVLLKMGSYGLLRATGMLPAAVMELQTLLAVLAFVSLIYGGLLAWRQTDLKAMIAYSSISHMGVVLLGIATLNAAGLTGAVLQMIAHGLVAGALFLLIGLLYERTHTRDVHDYSSLVRVTPRFAFFTTLAFVSAVGMPGTAGFIAELHALVGGFERWGGWIVILTLGMMISAAYAIRTIGRLFTGPVRPAMEKVSDLNRVEMLSAVTLSSGILALGVFPGIALQWVSASVRELAKSFS